MAHPDELHSVLNSAFQNRALTESKDDRSNARRDTRPKVVEEHPHKDGASRDRGRCYGVHKRETVRLGVARGWPLAKLRECLDVIDEDLDQAGVAKNDACTG